MKALKRAPAVSSVLACVLLASSAAAQQRETRPLEGFEAIEVGGGINLSLRQGERFVVEVVAEEDLDEIVTEVRGGTLEIRRKQSLGFFNWGDDHGSVNVTLPKLTALHASGGSDVTTEGTFSAEALTVGASGGSEVTLAVAAGTLVVEASGGSDMRLSGSARSARVQSSGGSDLDASRLEAEEADVESSGGSDLAIAVRDKIVANASGGSDIAYSGNPSSVNVNTSGGADITRR